MAEETKQINKDAPQTMNKPFERSGAKHDFVKSDDRGGERPASAHGPGEARRPRFGGGRVKSEFDQKPIAIRRVTRVVAGGRRMSFSVALLIGDRKGSIGLGTGKAGDTALSINKALRTAKKNLFKIKMTKENSIPHEVEAKFKSARLIIMPNRARGLVAG
ncbi:MAG: 30S ribosomal protein S5, partial [Candidatus Nomurabacteria bacterium GW2011_GWB1_37_5]